MRGACLFDRLPRPEDEIGLRRLDSRGPQQHRDLAAVVQGVPVELSQDVLDRVAVPDPLGAAVFERARDPLLPRSRRGSPTTPRASFGSSAPARAASPRAGRNSTARLSPRRAGRARAAARRRCGPRAPRLSEMLSSCARSRQPTREPPAPSRGCPSRTQTSAGTSWPGSAATINSGPSFREGAGG